MTNADRVAREAIAALRRGDAGKLKELGMSSERAASDIEQIRPKLSASGEPEFLGDMTIADKYFRQFALRAPDGSRIEVRVWLAGGHPDVRLVHFQTLPE